MLHADLMGSNLLLIRHGEAASNLLEDFSTWTDDSDELTELGKAQAAWTGATLRAIWKPGMVMLSSPLKRARLTAQLLAQELTPDVPVLFDDRLVEKDEVEGIHDAGERALACVLEYRARYPDLVCVTHGHVIQSLVGRSLAVADPSIIFPLHCGISYIRGGILIALNSALHMVNPHCSIERLY